MDADRANLDRSAALEPQAASGALPTPETLGRAGRVLEGLVTTHNQDGAVNISPMGPIVLESMDWLWFRPFSSSTTYANLVRERRGVFHVTDDVELLARAAVSKSPLEAATVEAPSQRGAILRDACRWYAFDVMQIDESGERASVVARVVERGTLREFFGFNRAKHAVVEAAILATRVQLLDPREILAEFTRLDAAVQKTGAAAEHRAMRGLRAYVQQAASGQRT